VAAADVAVLKGRVRTGHTGIPTAARQRTITPQPLFVQFKGPGTILARAQRNLTNAPLPRELELKGSIFWLALTTSEFDRPSARQPTPEPKRCWRRPRSLDSKSRSRSSQRRATCRAARDTRGWLPAWHGATEPAANGFFASETCRARHRYGARVVRRRRTGEITPVDSPSIRASSPFPPSSR